MNEDKQVAMDVLAPDVLDLIGDEEPLEENEPEQPLESEISEEVKKTNPEESKEPEKTPSAKEPQKTEEEPKELNEEELAEYLETGKRLKDYQKAHPGFDPLKIHGEFTRRSQELAEMKRELEVLRSTKKEEPISDISDIEPETLALLEKYTKAKGLVSKEEIRSQEQERATKEYETVKKTEINEFLEKHPEYKPENEKGDSNWDALLHELNGWYKLPENPKEIGALLERVHTSTFGDKTFDAKKAAKIIAQKKVNSVGASTAGGSVGSEKKSSLSLQNIKQLFKGYSDSELDDLFKE